MKAQETTQCNKEIAKERQECKKVIDSCNKTTDAKNKALKLSNLALKDCVEAGVEVQTELNATKDSLNAWYRNPFVMFGIGLLAGGLSYGLITRGK